MRHVRAIYDWVLSWAESPFGALALFLFAVAEASVFPIPPDVLLIALCIGHRAKAMKFATICTAGSVLGGALGYGIGFGMWSAVDTFFFDYVPGFSQEAFEKVQAYYNKYDVWIVFVAAFTPIPYKVITITAGVFNINFILFMLASVVGRAARFFLVAGLLYYFGAPIRDFIDKYFNILSIVFTILLIGSFVVLKLFLEH